ncbi:MAG: hypothetical protein WDM85_16930 [Caulobacteraceae bacterium]
MPTGNFGDAYAGYVASRMGLPIERIVLGVNSNDILSRALDGGRYARSDVAATSSPAMDIQAASNFERLYFETTDRDPLETARAFEAFAAQGAIDVPPRTLTAMRGLFAAAAVDEDETARTILATLNETGELVDPHTRRRPGRCGSHRARIARHAVGDAQHRPPRQVPRDGQGRHRRRAAAPPTTSSPSPAAPNGSTRSARTSRR